MVGVNFATSFIRPDGQRNDDTPLEEMIRHMDHLIEHVGVDGVGLGSDFDGATIPAEIGDVARPAPPRRRHAPPRLRRSDPAQALLRELGQRAGAHLGAVKSSLKSISDLILRRIPHEQSVLEARIQRTLRIVPSRRSRDGCSSG